MGLRICHPLNRSLKMCIKEKMLSVLYHNGHNPYFVHIKNLFENYIDIALIYIKKETN